MNPTDDRFEKAVLQTLNSSLDELDTEMLTKIGSLKYRAIDAAGQKKKGKLWWAIAPTALSLLIIILFNISPDNNGQLMSPALSELNMLTNDEPLDFYAQEIEFYLWFTEISATVPDQSGSPVPAAAEPFRASCTGGQEGSEITQSGTDRVSGCIRG